MSQHGAKRAIARAAAIVSATVVVATSTVHPVNAAQPAWHEQLPSEIRIRGVLNVGMAVGYAPFEYFGDSGTEVVGLDADLARAVGERMGVRVNLMSLSYDSLGPSLQTRRIDLIWSGEGDTRLKEQRFDYVDYLNNKLAILVRKGNPKGIHGVLDLCGRSVATGKTSATFVSAIQNVSRDCAHQGKPALQMLQFGSSNDVDLAVRSGRADAAFNAYPQAVFAASVPNAGTEIAAPPLPLTPIGVAVSKGSALVSLLRAVLTELIQTGRYEQILKQHRVWDCCRLSEANINGAAM